MRYWYMVFMKRRMNEDCVTYRAYGIRCLREDEAGVREVARVGDVSCDWWPVWELAHACTMHQLRPVQLVDVVEDWVAEDR